MHLAYLCVVFIRFGLLAWGQEVPQPPPSDEPVIRVIGTPDLSGRNQHYVSNRAPLKPSILIKLPIANITLEPKGWLHVQLRLMRDGFVGNLPKLSEFCSSDSGWLSPENVGWEEIPYWLRGYGDIGYVLKDEGVIEEVTRWLGIIMGNQEPDGYFGPQPNKVNRDAWPNMIMLYALRSKYEYVEDEKILRFMRRYFQYRHDQGTDGLYPYPWGEGKFRNEWWQHVRASDELDSVYWLYNRTGHLWLLDLAKRIRAQGADWSKGLVSQHGVNISQGIRAPAIQYLQTGDEKLLEAVDRNLKTVFDTYGQVPGGMFGCDEDCREGYTGPRQAAETCSMVESMHSYETLLKITGKPEYADRCEDVAFNSLPAAMSPDLRAVRYLTAPNLVQSDKGNKSPGLDNTGPTLSFDPQGHRCCLHNVGFGWPYFAEHLWMATPGNGLAAVFYAACEVKAIVGDGIPIIIKEKTEYPFGEEVVLTISTPKPVKFPLLLRIPGWCEDAALHINGTPRLLRPTPGRYAMIETEWKDGDEIRLRLPMRVHVKRWPAQKDAVSVHRGPLAYSLAINEKWVRSGHQEWPTYEVFPDSPWNYGLEFDAQDPAKSFQVAPREGVHLNQPWHTTSAPVRLLTKGRKIPAWKVDELGLVGKLQQSPARIEGGELEDIELIPMGCTRLRISMFPTIGRGENAHEWK